MKDTNSTAKNKSTEGIEVNCFSNVLTKTLGEGIKSAFIVMLIALMTVTAVSGCQTGEPKSAHDFRTSPIQSDLKITKVVLYQNGVGYFERRGRVDGNLLHLRIRPDQVKDVLKSLTVVDFKGGRATTISLPAEKKSVEALSQLPDQVKNSGGLLAIAMAFRGATAIVKTGSGTTTGRIVGVENLGNDEKPDWRLSILGKNGGLTTHSVKKIKSLRVLDKSLTLGLSKSLDVALNKGKWKPVTLTIRLTGKGPHDLVVSYVIPMPTWKPAYRLIVGEEDSNVLLQGWTVVDNLSGEDWRNVDMSLTAGTPLAFMYDLYSPRNIRRPNLTPSRHQMAEAPPPAMDATSGEMDKVMEKEDQAEPRYRRRYKRKSGAPRPSSRAARSRRMKMSDSLSGGGGMSGGLIGRSHRPKVSMQMMEKSYQNLVSGSSVGSLFRYDIEERITVPDRDSALVSIINKKVAGNDVLYHVVGSQRPNPYRAVKFSNNTGYVLERGPVAIYRAGTFVGEALGGRVEKNAVTFVPYAVEGRTIIHLSSHTKDEGVELVKIVNGYITVSTKNVTHFKYKVANRTGEKLTLYVTRRRRSGWEVVEPKNAIMEKSVYHAPIPLAKEGKTEFTVKEATPVRRRYTIFDSRARKAIGLFLKGSQISAELSKKLRAVLDLWEKIADLETQMNTLRKSMNMLRERTGDIRSNLKVLGKKGNSDLRRQLLKSLTEKEKELNELNSKWVKLNMENGSLKQRLQVSLRMIRFEKKK